MAANIRKSIVDMSASELHELLKPVALKAKQTALDNGAWYSYKNELCITPDMFIHEFKYGRKELIQLGKQTGEFTVLTFFINQTARKLFKN
jgi:hypothetical protein